MTITVALLVTDSVKDYLVEVVNAATPEYTIGFARKVCAISETATYLTPATHWYTNAEVVSPEVVAVWQDLIPTIEGVIMFTAINAENTIEWGFSNLASQGLMFVPSIPL